MIHISYSDEYKNSKIKAPLTKRGSKTRQKLLAAAEKIFGETGYFQASIVDITKEASVAQGTFYIYFPSKYDIFQELIMQMSKDFRSKIKGEIGEVKDYQQILRIGFQTFFSWVKEHRNLYSILQQALLVDENLYRSYYRRLAEGHVRELKKGIKNGSLKDYDLETIAYCLMGISQFIGMRWVYWENADVPEHVFEDVMGMIFNGLSAKE
ncbi:TetR/AcrR family transcriptional regulator [Schinkia sp. CFF1]